eukprot:1462214-Pyramimonas_sp.AAC.2
MDHDEVNIFITASIVCGHGALNPKTLKLLKPEKAGERRLVVLADLQTCTNRTMGKHGDSKRKFQTKSKQSRAKLQSIREL